MSISAWWMLALTWSVILFFATRFLWRVSRLDPSLRLDGDEEGDDVPEE
jgi:hypothetical protein